MADNQKSKITSEKPAHTYTKVEGKTRGKEDLLKARTFAQGLCISYRHC